MPCTRFHEPASGDADGRLPFALPGSEPRFARDRDVDVRHVRLDVTVDLERRRLSGRATHRLVPLRPGVRRIVLDALELEVEAVALGRRPAAFVADGQRLVVTLDEPLREGREVRLAIDYACTPRRGLHVIVPDADRPDRVLHAWTQAQDEDARSWWPAIDAPHAKLASEVVATVPAGMSALSNGRLVGRRRRGAAETWHWRQDLPHAPYLVTLAVGPFEHASHAPAGARVPMTTWHLPGKRAEALRVVRDTPRMLAFYEELTGVAYPWDKYDQVFVQDFVFGGMENTSATTLTDLVLHDRRAALDYTAEDLVAHELAHQWWGNLVTCRDWSQAWLNEGFATWAEVAWKEHARGEDEAWALRRDLRDEYLREEREQYRRPVACRTYLDPIELFDAHLYQKGAWIVDMLRTELGPVVFGRALRGYLEAHAHGVVETADLRRAVERASGRNLERFFEQWIDRGGHPEIELESSWDEDAGELVLAFRQVQSGEGVPEAFHLDLDVRVLPRRGNEWQRVDVALRAREQSVAVPLAGEPRAVVVDPDERVLKSLAWKRPAGALALVLERAPWTAARAEAAEALGRDGSARAVAALERALRRDPAWPVQAVAAAALGDARSTAALDALLRHLDAEHPKARRAVVTALGRFRDRRAAQALIGVMERGDPSYFVEVQAAAALGRTQDREAVPALLRALGSPSRSWNEVVRCGAIDGLGETTHGRRAEVVDALLAWTGRERFVRCRQAAIRALRKLGEGLPAVRERLEHLLEDDEFRVVVLAAEALAEVGTARSRGPLARVAESALDGRARRSAREALRRLADREPAATRRLRAELDAVAGEGRRLKDRLDRLEARVAGGRTRSKR